MIYRVLTTGLLVATVLAQGAVQARAQAGPALQFSSAAAMCQALQDMRSEGTRLKKAVESETNPIKKDTVWQRYRARSREVTESYVRSLDGAVANGWTGKVKEFDFKHYSNGDAALVSVSMPCSIPYTVHFTFMEWDGNPYTKKDYSGFNRWRSLLEDLAVGDTVTFSARFYASVSDNKSDVWLSPEFSFAAAATSFAKGTGGGSGATKATPPANAKAAPPSNRADILTFNCTRSDGKVTAALVVDLAGRTVRSPSGFGGIGDGAPAEITDAKISWKNSEKKNYGFGGALNFAGSIDRATKDFTFTGADNRSYQFKCR